MIDRRRISAMVTFPSALPEATQRRFASALARLLARQALGEWHQELAVTVEEQADSAG